MFKYYEIKVQPIFPPKLCIYNKPQVISQTTLPMTLNFSRQRSGNLTDLHIYKLVKLWKLQHRKKNPKLTNPPHYPSEIVRKRSLNSNKQSKKKKKCSLWHTFTIYWEERRKLKLSNPRERFHSHYKTKRASGVALLTLLLYTRARLEGLSGSSGTRRPTSKRFYIRKSGGLILAFACLMAEKKGKRGEHVHMCVCAIRLRL